MSEPMFSPEGGKKEPLKAFVKPIELKESFVCDCGKEIAKGEQIFEVLTDKDIAGIKLAGYLEALTELPKDQLAQKMCKDCMEKKIVKDKE